MKIPALLAALAIASGSALAAGNYGDSGKHSTTADTQRSTATDNAQHSGPSFVDKTKRAFRRMGEKLRNATHTDKDRTESASKNDTRSMGAAGSDTKDSARQRRMDDAYSNYQNKKPDQQK